MTETKTPRPIYWTDLLKIKKFAATGWGISPSDVSVRQRLFDPGLVEVTALVDGVRETYDLRITEGSTVPDHQVVNHLGTLHLVGWPCVVCDSED